jgi:hypothetical protein
LELDLTDRRHRERIPAELRPHLPEHGFANYTEAQAILRALEAFARNPSVLDCQDKSARCNFSAEKNGVAVIALYSAQAALIRSLVQQSVSLAQSGLCVAVGVPEDFREREFGLVLISLTRSHVHRAVAFGEGPRQLSLAMTRARRKVILFGDPGTLLRRRQWEGRLEQLTDIEAAAERAWVERLAHYLEGTGRHQRLFSQREGSSA